MGRSDHITMDETTEIYELCARIPLAFGMLLLRKVCIHDEKTIGFLHWSAGPVVCVRAWVCVCVCVFVRDSMQHLLMIRLEHTWNASIAAVFGRHCFAKFAKTLNRV